MKKNLPVKKQNSQVILSKTKSLASITNKVLSDKISFNDESWMQRLWDWADMNNIPQYFNHEKVWIGLPRNKEELLEFDALGLEKNDLSFIPKEIWNLSQLKMFAFWKNKLTVVPKEIGSLTNLTTLVLSQNQLTELPKEIGNLTNLTTLYLYENQLTELPKEIAQIRKLDQLFLNENPALVLTENQKKWIIGLKKNGCKVDIAEDLLWI